MKTKKSTPEAPLNPVILPLRVWWIPQIPMDPFYVEVNDTTQGRKILDTLANYDLFQFENKVKPDYSNTGGLQIFDNGEWLEWESEDGDDIYANDLEENSII